MRIVVVMVVPVSAVADAMVVIPAVATMVMAVVVVVTVFPAVCIVGMETMTCLMMRCRRGVADHHETGRHQGDPSNEGGID